MAELRLLTFGGLTLLVGGDATTGATTRRHRLALLALLAVARTRGLQRDKIHAYLWPESDAARARHGLNQLVYFQRQHLGGGNLFVGKKTLRLNREAIAVDVWEFEDALDAGAHEDAVRLYTGPFLDGFFLRDAPEFERWVEEQRRRLGKRCAEALGALAAAATGRGDHRGAVAWWRHAAQLDPYNSDTVLRLLEACVASGDRAEGVRHAQEHAELLRAELGLAPDPRVSGMVERLKAG